MCYNGFNGPAAKPLYKNAGFTDISPGILWDMIMSRASKYPPLLSHKRSVWKENEHQGNFCGVTGFK